MPTVTCTPEELAIVRQRFREAVKETPDLFDAADVAKVESDDWTVSRFIGCKKHDLDEGSAALIKAMKWRKSMDASNIKVTDFPAEFFWTGECHEYVRDKNNCAMVYCRVKYHKPLTDYLPITKRFLVYLMEKMDAEIRNGANGWALMYDCSGGTIFNNNMEILFFMIEAIFEYYPMSLTYVGLYELPWVMRAIYHICRGWIPEEFRSVLHFLNPGNIMEYVGQENLPDYLNGTCPKAERIRMPDNLSIKEFSAKNDIKESAVSKFFGHYKRYLDIGDEREEANRQETNDLMTVVSTNNNKLPVVTSA